MIRTTKRRTRSDGWVNYLTGLGVAERDKAEGAAFYPIGQIPDVVLTSLFREDYLCRLVVTKIVQECFRTPYRFTHEDKALDLSAFEKAWKGIVNARDYSGPDLQLARAWIAARLYGGGALWVGADDGQRADMPLALDRVKRVTFYRPMDRRELFPSAEIDEDPASPGFGEPIWCDYVPRSRSGVQWRIHSSRLIILPGRELPQSDRSTQSYWDDSVLGDLYETIRAYGTAWQNIGHLLQDMAQGILTIKGLISMITAKNKDLLVARMETLDTTRSNVRALVLDKDNEDFRREVTSLAGLSDVILRLNERVASAAEMPLTVLFGVSPAGLNATGESDLRLHYDRVTIGRETCLTPRLLRMAAPLAASMGIDWRGFAVAWDPPWGMTQKESAEYRKIVADTDAAYIAAEVFTPEAVAAARTKGPGGSWSDGAPEAPPADVPDPFGATAGAPAESPPAPNVGPA